MLMKLGSLALTLVLPRQTRLARRTTLSLRAPYCTAMCFQFAQTAFQPDAFFLIFLFPKTKKQNILVKIKPHVPKGCAGCLLAVPLSDGIPLCTKKSWERRKSGRFLCPSSLETDSCLMVVLFSIWLLQSFSPLTLLCGQNQALNISS